MTPEEQLDAGMAAMEQGDFATALRQFDAVIEADPTNGQALYFTGCAYSESGDYQQAIAAYERCVEHAGDRAALPLFNMGNAWQELGDLPQAVRAFQKAIEVDPTMADAWINLGRLLDDFGAHDTAIDCYNAALEIEPDDVTALSNRGNSLRSLEQFEEALVSYESALALDPDDFAGRIGRGICIFQKGDQQTGLHLLDEVMEATGHPLAMFEKAVLLGLAGHYEEALAMLDEVQGQGFGNAELFNNRGECLAQLDRIDEALAAFEQSLDLDEEFAPALFGKARLLVNLEKIDEARPLAEKLLGQFEDELPDHIRALASICGLIE